MTAHPLHDPLRVVLPREGVDLPAEKAGGRAVRKNEVPLSILIEESMYAARLLDEVAGVKDPAGRDIDLARNKG